MGNKSVLGCLGLIILIALVVGVSASGTYNNLVTLDQAAQAQWGNVQNVYQRRADLVPNLVATVKGVANFEKSTYIAVAEARAKVGQVTAGGTQSIPNNPQAFAQFQKAQDGLSSALSRLLVVVERYPDLKANQNFLDLQSQLEGTENRIAVERMRFNDAAQAFIAGRHIEHLGDLEVGVFPGDAQQGQGPAPGAGEQLGQIEQGDLSVVQGDRAVLLR